MTVFVSGAFVLGLTAFAFACDQHLWLPSWFPNFHLSIESAKLGQMTASLLMLAFAAILWTTCSWLRSQGRRWFTVAVLLLLIPVTLTLARRPIRRSLQLRAAHRARVLTDALDGYVRDHGAPPKSLEQLVPRYIHEVPTPGLLDPAMNQFIYRAEAPQDDTFLPFTLAFGVQHAIAGQVAVVYYPQGLPLQGPTGKQVVFHLSLPSSADADYFHEVPVTAVWRLDESWVFAAD
jgi:type II secretory pathway pseudopilin PulG